MNTLESRANSLEEYIRKTMNQKGMASPYLVLWGWIRRRIDSFDKL